MLAVVKTPLIEINIKGQIPDKLLSFLKEEYKKEIEIIDENELVDIFETDWYRKIKKKITPADNLRIYRKIHKITQTQLGKKLGGVPRQHISNMETGKRSISIKTAIKLSTIFNVTVDKFIQYE
ncbi:MAG: helix-turn-helix transcriptional regulator [Desulfobacterales bacterium]|nr:helix-turn-helix transcriptional regulator [Desulfobacterales bacterium]